LDYYKIVKDGVLLDFIRGSCNFIIKDLKKTNKKGDFYFSYTPLRDYCCHNANMLGASLLAKVFSITKEKVLLENAKKSVDFTLSHQKNDGSWNYAIDLKTGKEDTQIDFHQGFILDTLHDFIIETETHESGYKRALLKGTEFYRKNLFLSNGRPKWRWPKTWPADIHNCAQGIITFSKLSEYNGDYLEFTNKIANWTMKHMQDKKGYFYYQKWPFFTNKISYMRWNQAWMLLALSSLIEALNDEREK
jgi:hypothetical protein